MRAARFYLVEQPRLGSFVLAFKYLDVIHMLQGQANVIQTVQQAMLAEGIHVKTVLLALRRGDGLRLQVDHQTVAFCGLYFLEQCIHLLGGQGDGQNAVLETIVEEDICKAGGDNGAEAVVEQRPWGMLAAGTAAKVLARQQYASALVTRPVQREVRVERTLAIIHTRFAMVEITPLVKCIGAKACANLRMMKDAIGSPFGREWGM